MYLQTFYQWCTLTCAHLQVNHWISHEMSIVSNQYWREMLTIPPTPFYQTLLLLICFPKLDYQKSITYMYTKSTSPVIVHGILLQEQWIWGHSKSCIPQTDVHGLENKQCILADLLAVQEHMFFAYCAVTMPIKHQLCYDVAKSHLVHVP